MTNAMSSDQKLPTWFSSLAAAGTHLTPLVPTTVRTIAVVVFVLAAFSPTGSCLHAQYSSDEDLKKIARSPDEYLKMVKRHSYVFGARGLATKTIGRDHVLPTVVLIATDEISGHPYAVRVARNGECDVWRATVGSMVGGAPSVIGLQTARDVIANLASLIDPGCVELEPEEAISLFMWSADDWKWESCSFPRSKIPVELHEALAILPRGRGVRGLVPCMESFALRLPYTESNTMVGLSSDGQVVGYRQRSRPIHLFHWSLHALEEIGELQIDHKSELHDLVMNPNGQHVFAVLRRFAPPQNPQSRVMKEAWELQGFRTAEESEWIGASIRLEIPGPYQLHPHAESDSVLVTGSSGAVLASPEGKVAPAPLNGVQGAKWFALSDDGRSAVTLADGAIFLQFEDHRVNLGYSTTGLATVSARFSPDSRRVAILARYSNRQEAGASTSLRVWQTHPAKLLFELNPYGLPWGKSFDVLAWHPDNERLVGLGQYVTSGMSSAPTLHMWDSTTGRHIADMHGFPQDIRLCRVVVGEALVRAVTDNGYCLSWDLTDLTE